MRTTPRLRGGLVATLLIAALPHPAPALDLFGWARKKNTVSPPPAEGDVETITRAQIFLDHHYFGGGKIDGKVGEFTHKAVSLYNRSRGHENLTNWHPVLEGARKHVGPTWVQYQIRPSDTAHVNHALPTDPADQEGYPYLPYRSLQELVAERYHTDESFLAFLNPGRNLSRLRPGDLVTVPNVRPFQIETVRSHARIEADPKFPDLHSSHILIDTEERIATFWDRRMRLKAAFPITPGRQESIPVGHWQIVIMITTPKFRWDKQMLDEGTRGEEFFRLPPGPNSPVGILWAGLDKDGIGLHGTSSPRTIGRSRSAGCVRFANWDAIRLPELVRPGATVEVR